MALTVASDNALVPFFDQESKSNLIIKLLNIINEFELQSCSGRWGKKHACKYILKAHSTIHATGSLVRFIHHSECIFFSSFNPSFYFHGGSCKLGRVDYCTIKCKI